MWGESQLGISLWGTPVAISCPIGKCRTQVCESEFNTVSEKFLGSNFIKLSLLMSLHLCGNLIKYCFVTWDMFLSIEYIIGAPKEARCFLKL